MNDIKPSIPRTPAQVTLRIVSVVMALLGAVVVLGSALVFWNRGQLGLADESMWTVFTYGAIILAVAGLLLLTAWLGLRGADDSSKIGPYRGLCYFVGLLTLVAIVWGWGMGMFILFNPVVLASTVTYVLICSTLADKVAAEHDAGVTGEVFLRTGHQRTLHLMSEVIVMKGVLVGLWVFGVAIAYYLAGNAGISVEGLGLADSDGVLRYVVVNGVSSAINLAVGALGIYGSNRPGRVVPFMVVNGLSFGYDLVVLVAGIVLRASLDALSVQGILDMLYVAACAWISYEVWRQPAIEGPGAAAE